MTSLAYTCKFCRKPGFVHADEAGLEIIKPEKWLKVVCCTRCGKYMERKRSIKEALFKVCRALQLCRMSANPKSETQSRIMEHLVILTKKLAGIVCEYYRVTNVWEQEFAQQIFDHPHKLQLIASMYIKLVRAEALKERPIV